MSKNKNPLKDLDLFLKQQAASFVSPTPLSEKVNQPETPAEVSAPVVQPPDETLLQSIERLMDQNPSALYDLLIEAAEKKNSSERTMLINTALYLKNTNNWQQAIREYWKKSH
ncbi:MAG TPA: hypothetical protein VFU05_19210 [Cyclobacteriaceae bacterium]|nr:hypothetical protein [Cyclobacteriaceae bacterium]